METIPELEGRLETLEGRDRIQPLLDLAFRFHLSDLPSMRLHLEEALDLSITHGDREGESRSHNILSVYWGVLGDYEKALDEALHSLDISLDAGETERMATRYNNIGLIYRRMGDIENCRRYTEMAREAAEATGDERTLASALTNLGVLLEDEGDFDLSLDFYRRALGIREKLGLPDELALALVNVGELLVRSGRTGEALEPLQRGLAIAEEMELEYVQVAVRSTMGELLAALGRRDEAFAQLLAAREAADRRGEPDLQMQVLQNLVAFHETGAEYREALESQKSLLTLREKHLTEEKNRSMARLQTEFDTREKERQAEIYRLRNVELESAKEAAEAADRAKGDFLAMMSHEIRTPMNIVLGMMELPSETPLIPIQRDYLNKASIASRSLLGIINDILDFSRIESGHFQIGSFPFDPAALVLETVSLFETTLVDRGLLLDIHLDERMPSPLIGDPERIMQVLRNLLVNAVKFTCEGGITVSTRLESRDENGVVVEYSVVDTGIGIDIENVDALFEPFLQADSSISRRFGGTGLGLTICSRLVSAMDGSIRVESVPGGGSCFHFRLPLGLAGESVGALEPVLTGAVDISGSRVLLVEDVETIREITRLFLQGMGIDPEEASNGAEAVEKGCTGEFDLILMDVQMPGMDGLEATRELRERGVSAPVIAMTAHALARHHQECMESGMIDILTKPFSREELRTMLVRWLRAPGRSGLS